MKNFWRAFYDLNFYKKEAFEAGWKRILLNLYIAASIPNLFLAICVIYNDLGSMPGGVKHFVATFANPQLLFSGLFYYLAVGIFLQVFFFIEQIILLCLICLIVWLISKKAKAISVLKLSSCASWLLMVLSSVFYILTYGLYFLLILLNFEQLKASNSYMVMHMDNPIISWFAFLSVLGLNPFVPLFTLLMQLWFLKIKSQEEKLNLSASGQ